ncbi:hypothetical protein ACHQM5_027940 [Ranunculus cassubicifolius]
MALKLQPHNLYTNSNCSSSSPPFSLSSSLPLTSITNFKTLKKSTTLRKIRRKPHFSSVIISAALDLTEDNVKQVLQDARTEFAQIFDTSVGMTGKAELAEVDGPFVKIRLSGRFWHERSLVIARLGNYLKQKIPEILEVEVEDEKQLDDSPANF